MEKKNKLSGIYCIENIVNNKKYIGMSINVIKRLKHHRMRLNNLYHSNLYLQKEWDEYGEMSFVFFIVEQCSPEILKDREIFYVNKYDTKFPNGFNQTDGGEGTSGRHHTVEGKKKMSDAWKNFRRPIDKEWARKISESNMGKIFSEYSRLILSEKRKGEKNPFYGKTHTDEVKEVLSEYRLGGSFKKRNGSSSEYKGVFRRNNSDVWECYVDYKKKRYYVGRSKSEIECAMMYDIFCLEKEIQKPLNFPEKISDYLEIIKETIFDN